MVGEDKSEAAICQNAGGYQQPMTGDSVSLLHFHLDGVESGRCTTMQVHDDGGGACSATKQGIKACLEPESICHVRLMRHVHTATQNVMRDFGRLDAMILGTALKNIGYSVRLRSAIGGGNGVECFMNLRNVFLIVDCEEEREHYVIDPHFRDNFVIPRPTRRYEWVLDDVPEEVVLPLDRLKPLVTLLCHEMSRSFANMSMMLPPWRRESSILSKWMPSKSHDAHILPTRGTRGSPMPSNLPGWQTVSSNNTICTLRGYPHTWNTNNGTTVERNQIKEDKGGERVMMTKKATSWVCEGMHPIRTVRPMGVFPRLPPAA